METMELKFQCRRGTRADEQCPRGSARAWRPLELPRCGPEHVNDQPHFDNANPGNNGLGAQPLELPSQAALHAAVKNPQAAAVEHGNGDDAAQIPSAAAEHAQTNNAPGAASAHGDPSSFRGAAPEQVNDQPLFGDADPGNNGLGHQSRELPTQVAANAAAEIPSAPRQQPA